MKFLNGDICYFNEMVKEKKLICFGAGLELKSFLDTYSQFQLHKSVYRILDNSSQKIGTDFSYKGISIPIMKANEICGIENIIILISCIDIANVYEQLNQYKELSSVCCFATLYIRSETNLLMENNREYPLNFRCTSKPLIPKKIHYCWFGKNEIPEQNRQWIKSWRKLCPDYEIIEWNEDNYDITKNKYMHEAYKAGKWAFVSDYARLDIVYHHGGIYLDTDVEVVKNLDDLLFQHAFCGVETGNFINIGLGIGAEKGCSFIKGMCDMYKDIHFIKNDGTLDMTSQPIRQMSYFKEKGFLADGSFQILDGIMTVYPLRVLSPKCTLTGRVHKDGHTYCIHHYDASWIEGSYKDNKKRNQEFYTKMMKERLDEKREQDIC